MGKWYSLGLDLEWMAGRNALELMQFSQNTQKLSARLLTFPLVTVAALNGNSIIIIADSKIRGGGGGANTGDYKINIPGQFVHNCAVIMLFPYSRTFEVFTIIFSLLSVSLCPGHTYAGGVFIAITHDYLIMRSKKGWFCLSEVKINRNFSVGCLNLIKYVRQTS